MITLPQDIIGVIARFLNLQDLDNLSMSCQYLYKYLRDRVDRRLGRLMIDIAGRLIPVCLDFRVKRLQPYDDTRIIVSDYNDNNYVLDFFKPLDITWYHRQSKVFVKGVDFILHFILDFADEWEQHDEPPRPYLDKNEIKNCGNIKSVLRISDRVKYILNQNGDLFRSFVGEAAFAGGWMLPVSLPAILTKIHQEIKFRYAGAYTESKGVTFVCLLT